MGQGKSMDINKSELAKGKSVSYFTNDSPGPEQSGPARAARESSVLITRPRFLHVAFSAVITLNRNPFCAPVLNGFGNHFARTWSKPMLSTLLNGRCC